ncbi:hypothetical protein PCE1_000975 [Barthelona sp. PCE]
MDKKKGKKISGLSQFKAEFLKNFHYQKRSIGLNICLVSTSVILLLLMVLLQMLVDGLPNMTSTIAAIPTPEIFSANYIPFNKVYYADESNLLGSLGPLIATSSGVLAKYYHWVVGPASLPTFESHASSLDLKSYIYGTAWGDSSLEATWAFGFDNVSISGQVYDMDVVVMTNGSARRFLKPIYDNAGLSQISSAILDSVGGFDNSTRSIRDLPTEEVRSGMDISSFVLVQFFGMLMYLPIPVFLSLAAYEKEKGLDMLATSNGMRKFPKMIGTYLFELCIFMIMMAIFVFAATFLDFPFFKQNSAGATWTIMLCWSISLIAQSHMVAPLLKTARYAALTGFIIAYIFGSFSNLILSAAKISPLTPVSEFPFYMYVFPFFGLAHFVSMFNYYSLPEYRTIFFKDVFDTSFSPLPYILISWLVTGVIFWFVGQYLELVLTPRSSYYKNWLFFIRGGKKHFVPENIITSSSLDDVGVLVDGKRAVDANNNDFIKVIGVTKNFGGGNVVANASFTMNKGDSIGLLGMAEAGKSVLLNLLAGRYDTTAGEVNVGNMLLSKNKDKIAAMVGYAPQMSTYWDKLSAYEHMLYIGRLKGLVGEELKRNAEMILKRVSLWEFKDRLVGRFSGGMKRRCVVGVAIGILTREQNQIIIVDSPSTGLDPQSVNELHGILSSLTEKVVIFATSSMSEASALATKIVVMNEGRIEAIGSEPELQARYGNGYNIFIDRASTKSEDINRFLDETIPTRNYQNTISTVDTFIVPSADIDSAEVLDLFLKSADVLNIQNWGVSETSLNDVFDNIIKGSSLKEPKLHRLSSVMLFDEDLE